MASRVPLAAFVALVTVATPALAQRPSASARATARALMDEGFDRRERGDLKGALESFRAADALVHAPTSALEVARVEDSLGLLLEARDHLEPIVDGVIELDEPREFTEARAAAARLSDDLDARIPRLRLVVERDAASIALDGEPVPRAAADVAHRVDPGTHVVVVRSASGREVRATVVVHERETRAVAVALPAEPLSPAPAPAPAPAPGSAEPAPAIAARAAAVDASPAPHTKDRTIAWVAFGVAGAGLLVGTVAGASAVAHRDAAAAQCPGGACPASAFHDLDAARTASTLSDVGFGAMLLGLGVGVADLMLTRGRDPSMAKRVQPVVSFGGAGLRGSF